MSGLNGAEHLEALLGTGSQENPRVFDSGVMTVLRDAYAIPDNQLAEVWTLLEVGAYRYEVGTAEAASDNKAIRLELGKLQNAVTKVLDVMDGLSTESTSALVNSGMGRDLAGMKYPAVFTDASNGDQLSLRFACAEDGAEVSIHLLHLNAMLAALASCAENAQPWAGFGRQGRPKDEAAADLLLVIFQVWVSILNRDFTLDWHNGEPTTEAGRFCQHVCRQVDPGMTSSRIMTAARDARENGIIISGLENGQQAVDHYRKRLK